MSLLDPNATRSSALTAIASPDRDDALSASTRARHRPLTGGPVGYASSSRCVWLVGGTRPEALKLAPLATTMRAVGRINPLTVASGQHPTMFHQGLAAFGLRPDIDIGLHRNRGDQAELAARLIEELDRKMAIRPPAGVVVQGDTSTALITALIAFWRSVPVVHLEAGLRSHDLSAPFPEEANRRLIDQIASLHLAPTPSAAANLNAEGVRNEGVIVTGNTIVDAVLAVAGRPERLSRAALRAVADRVEQGRRLLLVTVHRRESWGAPMREILTGVAEILARYPDVEVVLPMHPNPAVRADVAAVLGGNDRALLTEPLDYPDLVGLLRRATLVLSDSGGIQEEAPTFRVPVLVLREVTERTEAVDAGCALLLGTERARIVATTAVLLDDDEARAAITSGGNPFGDGFAAQRAEQAVAWLFGLEPRRPVNFDPAPVGPSVSLARQ